MNTHPTHSSNLTVAAPVRRCWEALDRIHEVLHVCSDLTGAIHTNDARAYGRALADAPGVGLDATDVADIYATTCQRFGVVPEFGPEGCVAATACDECGAEPGEPCRPHVIATEQ